MVLTARVPLLLLLGLLPVVLRPTAGTAWLWVLVVALLVGLDLLLAASPGSLELERRPTDPVRTGEATSTVLLARARASIRAVVRDAWQPTAGAGPDHHRVRLPRGGHTVLETPLRPVRRGDLRATRVTVRSHGPLGLAARQQGRHVAGTVRSLPSFASRRHLPSRLRRLRELDGRAAVRVRGQGTEFDSLRDYVRGDDIRSIDWRATARSSSVVVRTWQPERDRRVVLVLDTSRTAAARVGDAPRLDAAMDAALLVAALAARAGDRVDLVAGDRRVRARVRAAGARDVVDTLQESLADLEPEIAEADWSTLAGAVAGTGRHRALVVLLTALDPTAVREGLVPVLPTLVRHHRVVVASVRDPALAELAGRRDSLAEVYDAAAAEQALAARRETADLVRTLGAEVVDADATHIAPALADHYLDLKARGLL